MRVKADLRGKLLFAAMTSESVDSKINHICLAIIIMALGDNPLRYVQDFDTAKTAWNKFQSRYAGKITINKIGV